MGILGMHQASRGEIIGTLARERCRDDGEAREGLESLGDSHSVLRGRCGCRPDQLASGVAG